MTRVLGFWTDPLDGGDTGFIWRADPEQFFNEFVEIDLGGGWWFVYED